MKHRVTEGETWIPSQRGSLLELLGHASFIEKILDLKGDYYSMHPVDIRDLEKQQLCDHSLKYTQEGVINCSKAPVWLH